MSPQTDGRTDGGRPTVRGPSVHWPRAALPSSPSVRPSVARGTEGAETSALDKATMRGMSLVGWLACTVGVGAAACGSAVGEEW